MKKQPKHMGLYRAIMSCHIGRDAIEGHVHYDLPRMEYAMFNLLHAVEEIAQYLHDQHEDKNKT